MINAWRQELTKRGISFEAEVVIPVQFKGLELETDLKCDLLVENCIAVELKAIEKIAPIHHSQLLTTMKLLKVPIGILLNFHSAHLFGEGQKTFVSEYYRCLT